MKKRLSVPVRSTVVAVAGFVLAAGAMRAETAAPVAYPLLTSCFEDAERIGEVTPTDAVKVRYASVASSQGACYSVSLNKEGRTVTGFVVGASLPAISQFEAEVRRHVPEAPKPEPPPPPATVAAAKPPAPERTGPESLSGLRGLDMNGHTVDLNALSARHVVVYFWSASDRRSAKKAETMDYIYGQYHSAKLDVVGVASALSLDQLRHECQQNEVVWPQVYDRGDIAKRFNVDPATPYMIVDRSRKVIAAVASPKELEQELRKLGLK